MTFSNVPVLARSRPAASVPSMRRRIVPSRAAMPSDETKSAAIGNRFHTVVSTVIIWCAEKRFVSFRPLPLRSWYDPRAMPTSASSSCVTSMPLGHVPGGPLSSAPSVFTSISAMKFEDTLFMSRMMSDSSSESYEASSTADAGTAPGFTRAPTWMRRCLSARRSVCPKYMAGSVTRRETTTGSERAGSRPSTMTRVRSPSA